MFLIYLKNMKEILKKLPKRTAKPRKNGLTMMMDKGLSLREAEDFLSSSCEYTDIIKLGFGTSILTPNITEKIKLYKKSGMIVYAGGTLFEAFAVRNQFDDYKKYMQSIGLETIEISDGSMHMEHDFKCNLISDFSKHFRVISEVGSKDTNIQISDSKWLEYIENEINSGSWRVITESREGGNVGIYDNNGNLKSNLIDKIAKHIDIDKILWEAPNKNQQAWFINKFGTNVNLGNISHNEIIPLECLRLGLRGDTFNIIANNL